MKSFLVKDLKRIRIFQTGSLKNQQEPYTLKKNFNRNKILETVWFVVAIVSVLAGIHKTYTDGSFRESYLFFIISLIAFLMFFFRRSMRKSEEKNKSDST